MEQYKLKLNLDGLSFTFEILNYDPGHKDEYDWLRINADFEFKDVINYHLKRNECMAYIDLNILTRLLDDLLNDKLKNEKDFTPLEPDLHFVMRPKYDIRNNLDCLYVEPGCEIDDIGMTLEVNLWNDYLTGNSFSMMFDRSDIEALASYLHLVKGEITISDSKIQKLIKNEIICQYTEKPKLI